MLKTLLADALLTIGTVSLMASLGIHMVTLPTVIYITKSQGREGIKRLDRALRDHSATHPLARRRRWMMGLFLTGMACFIVGIAIFNS